jgi:rubrerythrin
MQVEEAIKTAIAYEVRIRDIYLEAAQTVEDEKGKRLFKTLGDDEQHHIDYLQHKLKEFQNSGKIDPEKLESAIPSLETVNQETTKVQSLLKKDFRGIRQQMLSKALKAEVETSSFYQQMVDEMPAEAQAMFARFLEIENNHIRAIQFELDYVGKTGYWFDFKEFDME